MTSTMIADAKNKTKTTNTINSKGMIIPVRINKTIRVIK
jgi:hypothetical protein